MNSFIKSVATHHTPEVRIPQLAVGVEPVVVTVLFQDLLGGWHGEVNRGVMGTVTSYPLDP